MRQIDRGVIAGVRLRVRRAQRIAGPAGEVIDQRHAVRPARARITRCCGVRRERVGGCNRPGRRSDERARLASRAFECNAHRGQHLRANTRLLGQDAEEEMLRADVIVMEETCLGHRELQYLLRA
jgi:hypothetical protein